MINQDIQSRVDAFRGNPDALAQRYQQSQQLIDLLALQKIKSEKEAAARQMQMQMSQQQAKNGQPPTVAEQREQEVLDLTKNEVQQQQSALRAQQQQQQQEAMQKLLSGIAAAPGAMSAAQPQAMAAGGIVAFQEGGDVSSAEERLRQAQRALRQYGVAQRARDPEGYRSAQQEVETARAELMRVTAPQAETAAGLGAAQGLGMSRGIRPVSPPAAPTPTAPSGIATVAPPALAADTAAPAREAQSAAPPPAPRPAAPAGIAAVAPPATQTPAPAAQPGAELATPEMVQGTQGVTTSALGQDPEAIRRARAEEAAAAAGYTPEERAEKQSRIAELQALQPNQQALRDRRLIAGLLGAQSGYGIGSTLGAFGRTSVAEGEKQEAAQRASVLERQKMLDQLLEAGRAARMKGFDVGTAAEKDVFGRQERAAGDVTTLQRAQQTALDSALDRQSRERIAQAENAMRRDANAINAAGVAESRSARMEQEKNRLSIQISNYEQRIVDAVRKSKEFAPLELLETQKTTTGKLSPDQQIQYNKLKQSLNLAIQGAQAKANDLRRELGLPTRATPSTPDDKLEDFSLTRVRPSK